jgi:hypothetical protein
MSTTFVAVYRGQSVGDARLVAVSADPAIVSDLAARILGQPASTGDPVLARLDAGRRAALRVIGEEASRGT